MTANSLAADYKSAAQASTYGGQTWREQGRAGGANTFGGCSDRTGAVVGRGHVVALLAAGAGPMSQLSKSSGVYFTTSGK